MAKERRFPYGVAWILFAVVMVAGAGLVMSQDPTRRGAGLVLLLSPVLVFGLFMMLYYVKSRIVAGRED